MKYSILISLNIFFFSSCATMFNTNKTKIRVYTSQPAKIISGQDTLDSRESGVKISVPRHRKPLDIQILTDSVQKNIVLKPKISSAFYLNILNGGWGCFADVLSGNIYGFKREIFVDLKRSESNSYKTKFFSNKGEVFLHLSIPYFNNYQARFDGQPYFENFGFWGFRLGLDVFYKKNTFLHFSSNVGADYLIPTFPAPYYSDDRFWTKSLSFTHNHKIKRFTLGYGLMYGKSTLQKSILQSDFEEKIIEIHHFNTWGLHTNGYFAVGERFNIGIIYNPTFLNYNSNANTTWGYGHNLSLDLAWKIRLR